MAGLSPQPPRSSREIGPIGTASRVVGGVVAIVVPLTVWESTWWDWAAGLLGFPLLAAGAGTAVAALYLREPARSRQIGWGAGLTLVVVVLGSATALTYATPIDGTGVWIFLGASMLLAAAKGYGGCEVLAFANAVNGRQDRIGCPLYAPIDMAEAMGGRARE